MPPVSPTVTLIDPQGAARDVPAEQAGDLVARGWRAQSHADVLTQAGAAANQADYGGVRGAIGATGAAIARGATLGASDVAARLIGGDEAADTLRGLRAENPGLSFAGELGGAVAPALLSGGGLLPAGLASRAGRAVTAGAGGGLGGVLAGGAVEGALYGAGSGATELALDKDPLTLEHAASVLSSNMLYGGIAGGAGSAAFHGVAAGLGAARDAVDDALLSRSAERAMKAVDSLDVTAAAEPGSIGTADVATLDAKGLRAAEQHELEAIEASRQPEREAFVEDLKDAHKARAANKDWLAMTADRAPDQYAREQAKVVFNADRKIRNLLDNEVGLANRPARATEWLEQEQQALERLIDRGRRDFEQFRQAAIDAPAKVREELLANKIEGYRIGKGAISPTSPVIDDIVAREVAERFPRAENGGLIVPKELAPFEDHSLDAMLNRNRDLQNRINNLSRAPRSERLSEIEAAREALGSKTSAPVVESSSPIGHVLQVAAHAAGPLGAVATTAAKALGGLRKYAGAAAERAGQTASSFLDVAGRAAGKAAPHAPVLATKTLAALRYSDEPADEQPKASDLPGLYKARTDEIKSQVQMVADGSFQMRPEARQKMAAKLAGLGAVDPVAADRMESAGAMRIAWLASQIPRRPDIAGVPSGPDTWHPSDMEMRSWARKAAAAEDPHGVLDRVVHGQVTPEDAAAMRALYPEMMQRFINTVSTEMPTLQKTLPYQRRLSLSLFSGIPVDPALDPRILSFLQGQFPAEVGTAGGTQPAQPQPQFGSLKKSIDAPTPAQVRAQGAHV